MKVVSSRAVKTEDWILLSTVLDQKASKPCAVFPHDLGKMPHVVEIGPGCPWVVPVDMRMRPGRRQSAE